MVTEEQIRGDTQLWGVGGLIREGRETPEGRGSGREGERGPEGELTVNGSAAGPGHADTVR